jgi:hypothetical protein
MQLFNKNAYFWLKLLKALPIKPIEGDIGNAN